MSVLTIVPIDYKGEKKVALFYQYVVNSDLDRLTRALPQRAYSGSRKCWHIPFRSDYQDYLSQYYASIEGLEIVFNGEEVEKPINKTQIPVDNLTVVMKVDKIKRKIYIDQPSAPHLFGIIKATRKGFWIKEQKCWVFPGKNDIYTGLKQLINDSGYQLREIRIESPQKAYIEIPVKNNQEIERLGSAEKSLLHTYSDTLLLKRLRPSTCQIYVHFFTRFLSDHLNQDIGNLTYHEIYAYIKSKSKELENTQLKQTIAAIKFFYERVMDRDRMFFHLRKEIQIKGGTVFIPFKEIVEISENVGLASDRMLLYMAFHLQLKYAEIAGLRVDAKDAFVQELRVRGFQEDVVDHFKVLFDGILAHHTSGIYLFEDQGQAYQVSKLHQKLYGIIQRYRLRDIYQAQYRYILDGTHYSEKTKQMYLGTFIRFLEYYHFKHPSQIRNEEIRDYMVLHREKSPSHQDNMVNAFKFFFEKVHKSEISDKFIIRPRKGFFLPDFFSREEIEGMISVTENVKHRFLISLFYCSGMRREEVRQLRISDIDLKTDRIFIRAGKGNKDRYTLFSKHLHADLKEHLEKEHPRLYLFEGSIPGLPYSTSSMSNVLKKAALRSGIRRQVHLHMLRHSFATHLLEDGRDIRYIQELMGHRNIKTTTRYTQIVSDALHAVKSPFDKMVEQRGTNFTQQDASP
ncbi:MAG: tyrosine-type recombinase/integrase [Bacteroidales bacterium]